MKKILIPIAAIIGLSACGKETFGSRVVEGTYSGKVKTFYEEYRQAYPKAGTPYQTNYSSSNTSSVKVVTITKDAAGYYLDKQKMNEVGGKLMLEENGMSYLLDIKSGVIEYSLNVHSEGYGGTNLNGHAYWNVVNKQEEGKLTK